MDALQQQVMANAGRERAATELRGIDGALARIRNGTFGECARATKRETGAAVAASR
jgi:RNA polymerase-binding transcription factor DksA